MSKNEDQDQNGQDTCEGRFIATVSSSSRSRSRNSRTQDLPVYTASCLSNLLTRRLIISTCFEVLSCAS
jgi:hypothetical protein